MNKSKPSAGSIAHDEKKSHAPLPAGHHQASTGEVIQKLPQVKDQRIPSTPDSITDRSRKDKQRVQGEFGVASRGHDYKYSDVKDAVPKKRTDVEQHKYERAHGNPKLRGKDRF